ncbi:MAG: hypothetical protein V1809_08905 [Planctomycetota bacterium]
MIGLLTLVFCLGAGMALALMDFMAGMVVVHLLAKRWPARLLVALDRAAAPIVEYLQEFIGSVATRLTGRKIRREAGVWLTLWMLLFGRIFLGALAAGILAR